MPRPVCFVYLSKLNIQFLFGEITTFHYHYTTVLVDRTILMWHLNIVKSKTCSYICNILSHLLRPFPHMAILHQVTSGFADEANSLLHTRSLVMA
jgi:hypothetical protein